jgi:ATP-binding cassette subfamily C (CFTR/MRP) protein 1
MAGASSEKETDVPDPVARYSQSSLQDEPVEEEEEIAAAQLRKDDDDEIRPVDDGAESGEDGEKRRRPQLNLVKSYATGTSAVSAASEREKLEQKPWYKQPNPLRWGKIPPVPGERKEPPEYKAGFFNLLFFQWMAPLMQVSKLTMSLKSPFQAVK